MGEILANTHLDGYKYSVDIDCLSHFVSLEVCERDKEGVEPWRGVRRVDGWHGCCRYPFAGKRSSSKLSVQVTVFKQPYFSCTKSYIFPIGDAPCILDYILKCPSILIM